MNMVFAFDIDGTVMHSWRQRAQGDVCVERIDGIDHGFMSRDTIEALANWNSCHELIPVTSRSVAQFLRIEWPEGLRPEIAFVDNAAYCLHYPGTERESLKDLRDASMVASMAAMDSLAMVLNSLPGVKAARVVDGAYVIAISLDDANPNYSIKEAASFTLFREGRKAYFFPVGLQKSTAVVQIRELFSECIVVSAGDSANDFSMLKAADKALFPSKCHSSSKHTSKEHYEDRVACWIVEMAERGAQDGF